VPPVAAAIGWRWAFVMLAAGPVAGIAAIQQLRRSVTPDRASPAPPPLDR
jgi:predicted MFS family arabinose efflux permease